MKKLGASGLSWLWVTVLVLLIDRLSKLWVVAHLGYLEPLEILPIFNFTLAYNTGAAFSFLHSMSGWQNLFLGGLASGVSLVVLWWLATTSRRLYWLNIALCLILGGALGNVWDRASYSHVIDFLDFHWGMWHFAIFNVADTAICIGAFMLFLSWIRQACQK